MPNEVSHEVFEYRGFYRSGTHIMYTQESVHVVFLWHTSAYRKRNQHGGFGNCNHGVAPSKNPILLNFSAHSFNICIQNIHNRFTFVSVNAILMCTWLPKPAAGAICLKLRDSPARLRPGKSTLSHLENGHDITAYFILGMTEVRAVVSLWEKYSHDCKKSMVETLTCMQSCIITTPPFSKWDKV